MPELVPTATPLADLHPAAWNPRTIRDERFANLCRSIETDPEFLWLRPVLATPDGAVYAGNMRWRAAEHLGLATIPAIITDIPARLAKERALRDNAQWGENDTDMLADLLAELAAEQADMTLLGFDDRELVQFLANRSGQLLTDPDAAPPVPDAPTSRRGDVWLLGEHRVMCGDATSQEDVARLLAGAVPNLMVTDPSYGVDYDPKWRNEAAEKGLIAFAASREGMVTNDDRIDWSEAWALFPGSVVYCWHADRHASAVSISLEGSGFEIRNQVIWAKPAFVISRGHYNWQHEPCWYAVRKGATASWIGDHSQSTLWSINGDKSAGGGHGTQKPVECMARPIGNHEGDVYDPFIGSGSTLIACEQLGRRCYGMEIEPRYVDVIRRRYQEATGIDPVLAE